MLDILVDTSLGDPRILKVQGLRPHRDHFPVSPRALNAQEVILPVVCLVGTTEADKLQGSR
jgi:hypothetical protein